MTTSKWVLQQVFCPQCCNTNVYSLDSTHQEEGLNESHTFWCGDCQRVWSIVHVENWDDNTYGNDSTESLANLQVGQSQPVVIKEVLMPNGGYEPHMIHAIKAIRDIAKNAVAQATFQQVEGEQGVYKLTISSETTTSLKEVKDLVEAIMELGVRRAQKTNQKVAADL